MEDISAVGENLMDDARIKAHSFYYRIYPYTVDYQEEDEVNGMLKGLIVGCLCGGREFQLNTANM